MPCSLALALILVIHRVRLSRFFSFRPVYARASAFSTRLRAMTKHRLARPRYPLASCSIFLCRARAAGPPCKNSCKHTEARGGSSCSSHPTTVSHQHQQSNTRCCNPPTLTILSETEARHRCYCRGRKFPVRFATKTLCDFASTSQVLLSRKEVPGAISLVAAAANPLEPFLYFRK